MDQSVVISTLFVAFSTVEGHFVTISQFIVTFSTFNTVIYDVGDNIPRRQLSPCWACVTNAEVASEQFASSA